MKFNSSLVSVDWLNAHIDLEHLIILDASIPKVGNSPKTSISPLQIPRSRFFDLKKKFCNKEAAYPNTLPSIKQFELQARKLGINSNSQIIIYDDLGVYSSPRAWWLFKLMGFDNVAVLNGGLPAWKLANYPLIEQSESYWEKGNFHVNYRPNLVTFFEGIQTKSKAASIKIIDARSKNRFHGLVPEPRLGLRSGNIPNSVNLPYFDVIESTSILNASTLQSIFNNFVKPEDTLVFSCGSGITACILALAADLAGFKKWSVYDGSWTEYGSLTEP